MKTTTILKSFFAVTSLVLFLAACSSNTKKTSGEIVIHNLSDPDMLNPINYSGADAGYILNHVFQGLTSIDYKTLQIVPEAAENNAVIEKTPTGGMKITYRLRDEAQWDDGTPITAKDVEFSLKVIKCPKVDNQSNKPYYEFINDMVFYPEDAKKLTFICKEVYMLAEISSGGITLLPEKIYDPKGLLKEFTVKQLSEDAVKLAESPKIIEFAKDFNSEKYQREKGFIIGSGAYEFVEWQTGQRIVLQRKKNWWGDKVTKNKSMFFDNYPPRIIYQTINDQTTALVALKAGNLDLMHGIKAKDFVELPKSEKFTANFNSFTPMMLAYSYLGINTRLPKFKDKKTRQALAHLVDVDKIIKTLSYGLSQRTVGPILPANEKEYNKDLVPYTYDVELAKKLLAEAGWKDSNGDGILDKMIDGKLENFTIEFSYNSGNDSRKAVALMFQEEARKAGIQINVVAQEWSKYLDNQKNHQFEMYYGSWISSPIPNDHKQIFHSESYNNGGSNYVGFGNPQSDALIDSIRVELDANKRAEMNKRFQVMLYDEVPYIFMSCPKETIAIHKRFTNAEVSVMRPGYWEASFKASEKW